MAKKKLADVCYHHHQRHQTHGYNRSVMDADHPFDGVSKCLFVDNSWGQTITHYTVVMCIGAICALGSEGQKNGIVF